MTVVALAVQTTSTDKHRASVCHDLRKRHMAQRLCDPRQLLQKLCPGERETTSRPPDQHKRARRDAEDPRDWLAQRSTT
jgi:hypothetical protein